MSGRPWTAAQLRTLRRLYPDLPASRVAKACRRPLSSVYQKAAQLGLRKSAAFLASDLSGRIRRGRTDPRMTATQFRPGHQTWNKGVHYVAGGRSAETRFRPGHYSQRWDAEAYSLGALRVTTDGVLMIKATPDRDRSSWQIMARFVWETEVGPIPRGHVVRARNGDSHDTRIENLELVSRADNARRNSLWTNYPREVAQLIQLKGAIRRQVNRITNNNQERT